MLTAGFQPANTTLPADWLKGRVLGWQESKGVLVGSVAPTGFDAYARILHPAERQLPDRSWRSVSWAELAQLNDKEVTPEVLFRDIINTTYRSLAPSWLQIPEMELPKPVCQNLVNVLQEHTTPKTCYFALWRGYSFMYFGRSLLDRLRLRKSTFRIPRVHGKDYLLFGGPLASVLDFYGYINQEWWYQPPNYWWPEDQAWCVSTDIDTLDTLVAGSERLIAQVFHHPELESIPITTTSRLSSQLDV